MACVLALTLCVPAMAAVEDTGFSDVAANAWYADAAIYVRDHGIMNGTSGTTFSPNSTMTRACLPPSCTVRQAALPSVRRPISGMCPLVLIIATLRRGHQAMGS